MKTNQILQLDCRKEENREIIQKVLRQVKPLSKCSENIIPIEMIERIIKVICSKYGLFIRQLYPDCNAGDTCIVWRSEIFLSSDLSKVDSVYGCTVYECLAKTAILLYAKTRSK